MLDGGPPGTSLSKYGLGPESAFGMDPGPLGLLGTIPGGKGKPGNGWGNDGTTTMKSSPGPEDEPPLFPSVPPPPLDCVGQPGKVTATPVRPAPVKLTPPDEADEEPPTLPPEERR